MKKLHTHIKIVRAVVMLALLLSFAVSGRSAGSYSGYVGQYWDLDCPTVYGGNVYAATWQCKDASLRVTILPNNRCRVTIEKYFTGIIYVTCVYYYILGSGVNQSSGNSSTTFTFTCKPVTLTLSETNMTLNPGQGKWLNYSLNPSISPTPQVNFSSNSSAVTVNNAGYVYAVRPGDAVITATNSAGTGATCYVKVNSIPIQNVTIPSTINIKVGQKENLQFSVYPSNATVTGYSWYVKSGSEYVTLYGNGELVGKSPGTATICCTLNNYFDSNVAIVNVSEPDFTMNSSSPSSNATGISAFAKPSVTYSLDLYKGDNFSNITLKNKDTGANVDGTASISGAKVTFTPAKPLSAITNFLLTIPANAVKNKWGTHYNKVVNVNFKTGKWEKLTLSSSPETTFIEKGSKVTLKASVSNAKIFYTIDGSNPTENSLYYTSGITMEKDFQLRAVAISDGYESSDILSKDYILSNVEITKRFPEQDKIYIYRDVSPFARFSNAIEPSDNVNGICLKKDKNESIYGEIIVADSTIFYIPSYPLEIGCMYELTIPANAVKTWQGEPNKATTWTIKTNDYPTDISSGPELAAAVKKDGSLVTWGEIYQSGNNDDGSYQTTPRYKPTVFVTEGVNKISSGYMHHALIKADGSLWMWGRQYCGEFGNNSNTASSTPVKVMDGVAAVSAGGQTTAILKNDNSLWMCGRNDFGQIGDSSVVTRKSPVKIMDDVSLAVAGWCTTYAVKNDGSLWAWGRNDKGQFGDGTTNGSWKPVKVMDDVAMVDVPATEGHWVGVVKKDGSLWTWNDTQTTPVKMIDNVKTMAVGIDYVQAVKEDGSLWAAGYNSYGQVGDGSTQSVSQPKNIMQDVNDVSSGGNSTLALTQNGNVYAWGLTHACQYLDENNDDVQKYHTAPFLMIEGRTSSQLTGIAAHKNEYKVKLGDNCVMEVSPIPLNADYSSLEWSSSNPEVAAVDNHGVITAGSLGTTDVTAKIENGKGDKYAVTCHVKVVSSTTDKGDVNGDGEIDVADAVTILNHVVKKPNAAFNDAAADVNDDGEIDLADAITIVNIVVRNNN